MTPEQASAERAGQRPLTRRELRERERAQFARAVNAQPLVVATRSDDDAPVAPRQHFDSAPVVLVPPVFEEVAPSDVLALEPPSPESRLPGPVVSNAITELPVPAIADAMPQPQIPAPETAAPWPAWASKPAVAGEFTLVPEVAAPVDVPVDVHVAPAATASHIPDVLDDVEPVPSALATEVPVELRPAVQPDAVPAPAAAPAPRVHRTRPSVPEVPRLAPKPLAVAGVAAGASARPQRLVLPKESTPSLRRRVLSKVFSTAALLFAGALLVGSSIPANAFVHSSQAAPTGALSQLAGGQSVEVSDTAIGAEDVARDADYGVLTYAERLAAKYGETNGDFVPTSGAVRWPFPYSVPTTDGFGPRVAPCAGCSTFHNGLDFVPGAGVPIYAVASGTVSFHAMDGSLGNKVEIEHVINGQAVQSVYAHMQLDSSPLAVGDKVKVGDFIGLVGATGIATAPHLHLEIHLAGVPTNPYTWLQAHAR